MFSLYFPLALRNMRSKTSHISQWHSILHWVEYLCVGNALRTQHDISFSLLSTVTPRAKNGCGCGCTSIFNNQHQDNSYSFGRKCIYFNSVQKRDFARVSAIAVEADPPQLTGATDLDIGELNVLAQDRVFFSRKPLRKWNYSLCRRPSLFLDFCSSDDKYNINGSPRPKHEWPVGKMSNFPWYFFYLKKKL